MEWTIVYWNELKILYIKTRGILTAENANVMVKDIVDEMSRHECEFQIVDHSNTEMNLSVLEYYERPNVNERIGISRSWKIAMVFNPHNENIQFMETVFRNRGYEFRGFLSLEEAKAWISSYQ
jgi:hypothetical protein